MVTVRIHSHVLLRVVVVAGRLQRVQRRRDGESSGAAPAVARSGPTSPAKTLRPAMVPLGGR